MRHCYFAGWYVPTLILGGRRGVITREKLICTGGFEKQALNCTCMVDHGLLRLHCGNQLHAVATRWPHGGHSVATRWPHAGHLVFFKKNIRSKTSSKILLFYNNYIFSRRARNRETLGKTKWPPCGHRVATVWPSCGHRPHPTHVRLSASSLALLLACLPARVHFARLLICPPACLLACWQSCICRVQQHLSSQVFAWQRPTPCKLIFRKLTPPSPPRVSSPRLLQMRSCEACHALTCFCAVIGSGVCENNVGLESAGWLCRLPPDPLKVQC